MSLVDDVEKQLRDELGDLARSITPLMAPRDAEHFELHILGRPRQLATQLCGKNEAIAANTVIDVIGALWPHANPERCGRADWWTTPLGRVCARSLGKVDAEAVTQHVAAAMLGVTRGTVAQMVHRGTLDRHPDGGVLRASVLQRLSR